jgi:hypothetical protein
MCNKKKKISDDFPNVINLFFKTFFFENVKLSSGEVPTYFSFYFLLHNSLICHNFPGSQYLQWWLPGRLRVDSGSAPGRLQR